MAPAPLAAQRSDTWNEYSRRPAPPLDVAVERLWCVRGPGRVPVRLPPLPFVELVINLGAPCRLRWPAEGSGRRPARLWTGAWIEGFRTGWLGSACAGPVCLIGARLSPAGASALFGAGCRLDRLIPAGEALDPVVKALRRAASVEAACATLEAFLRRRLARTALDQSLVSAARALADAQGVGSIAALTANARAGHDLARRFRRLTGVPLKRLARVVRLQAMIGALRGSDRANWHDLVARFGFYDQAHLIREFRGMAGVPPTRFLARRDRLAQGVVVEPARGRFQAVGVGL